MSASVSMIRRAGVFRASVSNVTALHQSLIKKRVQYRSVPRYIACGRTQRDFSVSLNLSDAQQNDFENVLQECDRTSHQRKA